MTPGQVAALAASSVGAGVMNAMAGGGTILTFPALLLMGEPAITANATSAVALWPGAAASLYGYREDVRAHRDWVVRLLLPSLLGGAVGAVLLLRTPPRTFEGLAPALVLFATALFAVQGLWTRRTAGHAGPAPTPGRRAAAWIFQFAVAVYGGYFGAGIGILMLAVLGFLGLSDIHAANGLKNVFAMAINGVAAAYFVFRGAVDWPAALILAAGAVAGGYAGARFARSIGREKARAAVVVIGVAAAAILFVQKASGSRHGAAAPGASSAAAGTARYDGVRIHFESFGSGAEALVFVHGLACDLDVWRFQAPVFSARTRVLLVDLPGFGASDKPRRAYTMDFFARSVDAVLHEAGVARAVLVGHSMGTPVVRQFARLFPGETLALVAVDGSLRKFPGGPEAADAFIAPFRSPQYREATARVLDASFPTPGTEALRDREKAVALSTPQHVMVSALEGMFDPAIWSEDPIGVPLLVVTARSTSWGPDYEAAVRRLAPAAEYHELEGTGHFLMLEKAEDFNAILAKFLAANRLLGFRNERGP